MKWDCLEAHSCILVANKMVRLGKSTDSLVRCLQGTGLWLCAPASWSSGSAFVSGARGVRTFQIGHRVANGSPPLRHPFKKRLLIMFCPQSLLAMFCPQSWKVSYNFVIHITLYNTWITYYFIQHLNKACNMSRNYITSLHQFKELKLSNTRIISLIHNRHIVFVIILFTTVTASHGEATIIAFHV